VGVLETIYEAISNLLKGQVDKKTMLENLELILLTMDEAIDHGHIMELESQAIVGRVLMKGSDPNQVNASSSSSTQQVTSVGDLSLSQALGLARDQFFKTLAGGRTSDGY
jgi:hypothetical protein